MSKYGNLEIEVKIYESKNAEAKAKDNGRIFQMMGSPVATIKIDGKVMFEKLSGMFGVSYKDQTAYDKNEGMLVVMYDQSYTAPDTGKQYDKVVLGDYLNSLLNVETMVTFTEEGFAHSERDEAIAENAGITAEDYLTMSKAAMAKAASFKGAVVTHKTITDNTALEAFDKELSGDIG